MPRRWTPPVRIGPGTYRRITLAAVFLLAFIVVTGGAVRLAGSGLGCPDWPTCDKGRIVAPAEIHAWIEFGNRLVTGLVSVIVILAVLGSLVRAPRRRDLTLLSVGLVGGVQTAPEAESCCSIVRMPVRCASRRALSSLVKRVSSALMSLVTKSSTLFRSASS